jgi:predicted dithiol-disulfide oxidoreductase (DUF899 family)
MIMATSTMKRSRVVSPAEWLAARKQFLIKEKEFTRLRDELARERRELPWERVDKQYVFDTPDGKKSLADLFAGRSQLVVYHFMFGPEWKEGCPSCSMAADTFDGAVTHLAQRDISFVAVSRATLPQIETFKKRMGWRFPWVSSNANEFNRDYHVSFTKDELAKGKVEYNYGLNAFPSDEAPGLSVFYKDPGGEILHTYSAYARGLDELLGPYIFLDRAPKGRDEDGLPFTMSWVRHHDKYDNVTANAKQHSAAPMKSADGCCAEHHS